MRSIWRSTPRPLRKERRRRLEQPIQQAVFLHLAARGMPGIVAWHTPNGGARSKVEAAIFKSMGVKAGFPDVAVLAEGVLYVMEIKAEGGRTTPKQDSMLAALAAAGARTAVAVGLDAALAQLEAWGLLRPAS